MRLSTPTTSFSISDATDCSTTEALAPMYVVCTWMSGGEIGGNCATGSTRIATAPSKTMTMESTIAKIGRVMKKCATDYSSL